MCIRDSTNTACLHVMNNVPDLFLCSAVPHNSNGKPIHLGTHLCASPLKQDRSCHRDCWWSVDAVFFSWLHFFFDSLLIVAACKHSCKTGAFSFSSAAHLVSEKEIKSSGELRLKREGFLMLHKLWHSFSISPWTFLKISLLNPGCAHTAFAA